MRSNECLLVNLLVQNVAYDSVEIFCTMACKRVRYAMAVAPVLLTQLCIVKMANRKNCFKSNSNCMNFEVTKHFHR